VLEECTLDPVEAVSCQHFCLSFCPQPPARQKLLHSCGGRRPIQRRHPHPSAVTFVSGQMEGPFRGSTRSSRWQRLSHGLYVPRDSRRLQSDLEALRLILPSSACFTSLTAAGLRGWWSPSKVGHPVFVSVPSNDPHPQRRGLLVTRHPRAVDSELIDGIQVASAAETLLAVARDLSVLDLVILGDSALHLCACTKEELVRR
jgi:hypothetical protein